MSLPRLENAQVGDSRVLFRADFTAALDANGKLTNESLLLPIKPSIELLLNRGASVIIAAHAGQPGQSRSPGLAELAEPLSRILGTEVRFEPKAPGAGHSAPGDSRVTLLEDLLVHPGELKGDKAFARNLAGMADLYVNDSFGACRYEFASIVELPKLLPSFAGMHLYKEKECLEALLSRTNKPFVVILGGVRLEQKIKLMLRLLEKIDTILIGGGLAYTFLKSRAIPVGSSFVEKELEVPAFQMIEKAELSETELVLPLDHVAAEQFSRDSKLKNVGQSAIPDRWLGLDIGAKTISRFEKAIKKAGCVFWYGPMGAIEIDKFSKGTQAIATALAKSKAHTVAAGVDTVRAVHATGLADRFAHLSADSATAVDFLLNGTLPGLTALARADD